MDAYVATCENGHTFIFETDAQDGEEVWAQCGQCEQIVCVELPGERQGRTIRTETQIIYDAIFDIFAESLPQLTVRQVYYQLAVRELVPKSNRGYRTAQYHLAELRRKGILPFGWIADNTRWHISPIVYRGLESAMEIWHETYRRDLWAQQPVNVEIWVEKDAMAGVLAPITQKYQAPLYVARGFSSMTFAFEAAENIKRIGKPTIIYHFGDFDPSGQNAADKLQEELDIHGAQALFYKAAVTFEQIIDLDLPTLPVNMRDPRAKTWLYPFVAELEAYPARDLRLLVEDCITQHIDLDAWENTKQAEDLEKTTLYTMRYFVQEQNNNTAT